MRFNLRHIVPIALLSLVGCGVETPVSETVPGAAEELGQGQSMLQLSDCPSCLVGTEGARFVSGFERERVVDDVYHYRIRLRVGDTANDVITLHRVVREKSAWWPRSTPESVFMVHGDAWNFQAAFMSSTLTTAVADNKSIAVYLAKKDVDVWGIDLRWTHVPQGTQDFSFMKDWNLGTHARDVGTGLTVARTVRTLTGSGDQKMNLLGWSRGALVGYAYMNAETQRPQGLRHVSGFIPVDMVMKFGPEAEQQRQWACVRATVGDMVLRSGRFEGNLSGPGAGTAIQYVGQAATEVPDAPAQIPGIELPPINFRQLGILVGAATFSLLTNEAYGIQPSVPFYHFSQAKAFSGGLPTALENVEDQPFFDFLSTARPFQSFTEMVESDRMQCGDESLPYDDHLAEVKVPVLYVGAAGGFGSYGVHSAKRLGSKDVSVHLVQKQSDANRIADYGHADLFLAKGADKDVWEPIYKWMKKH
jgi:pimeloyl-ACP methyl ester carboxylesterase